MFINRELSWLDFNDRVLEEAEERREPAPGAGQVRGDLSSNLDEFFMIRVAGIKRKLAAGIAEPGPDGRTPTAQLAAHPREDASGRSIGRRAVITER